MNFLGLFIIKLLGIGDMKVLGFFKLFEDGMYYVYFNGGFSFFIGLIDEEDDVLMFIGVCLILWLLYFM